MYDLTLFQTMTRGKAWASYYGYLEDLSETLPRMVTPSGEAPPPGFPSEKREFRHWRFSVVRSDLFDQRHGLVQPIPLVGASGVERRRRRDQLRTFFSYVRPETLDLFPRLDAEDPALATAYRLGGWLVLDVGQGATNEHEVIGLIGGRSADADAPVHLRALGRVEPEDRELLRKVFSLAHVGRLGDGDEGPSTPIRTPPSGSPQDKPKGAADKAPMPHLIRFARSAPESTATTFTVETLRGKAAEPQRQVIQVKRG